MAERLAQRLLLVGWDSADWKLITPLLEQGLMPALERVVNGGVMGNLATLHPILSPLLWNSIATGKRPHQHGVLGFVEPDPHGGGIRPVSSTSRQVKAVWNILTQRGLRTHVVGWFAGHPAEPVNGVYVSPLHAHPTAPLGQPWPLPDGAVHPARVVDTLAGLRVHPGELPPEALLGFVPRAAEIDQQHDRHLAMLARALAHCVTVHNAATWALEHEPWDFAAVYYNAIDTVCHHFMRYRPPRMADVHPRQLELYGEVVNGIYRFHDLLLARLLELAGPETTVVLLSDHGFHADHLRPRDRRGQAAGPEAWHREHGILCLTGPGIRRDERVYGATLLDVTPTVLTLFGLPVGQDMAGKPLLPAFERPVEPERIPSWENEPGECGMHPPDLRTDPAAAETVLQQFVALGYVEAPTEDQARARAQVARQLRYNLARSYLGGGRPQDALAVLEGLAAEHAADPSVAVPLAECYLRLGRRADARRVLEPVTGATGTGPWASLYLGVLEFEEGNVETALLFLKRAEAASPRLPGLHVRIGNVYLRQGHGADARRAFEKALEIDPDSARAHLGLAVVAGRERRPEDAVEHALTAVGLQHYLPLGHYHLGVALARLGQLDRAIQALEAAVHMAPGLLRAHRWLTRLCLRTGDLVKAARHQVMADELRRRRRGRTAA